MVCIKSADHPRILSVYTVKIPVLSADFLSVQSWCILSQTRIQIRIRFRFCIQVKGGGSETRIFQRHAILGTEVTYYRLEKKGFPDLLAEVQKIFSDPDLVGPTLAFKSCLNKYKMFLFFM